MAKPSTASDETTLVVDTTSDTAGSTTTCTKEATHPDACSLRTALAIVGEEEVGTTKGPYVIELGAGTYKLSLAWTTTATRDALSITSPLGLTISGAGPTATIIEQTAKTDRVFQTDGLSTTISDVTIQTLAIKGGTTPTTTTAHCSAGSIGGDLLICHQYDNAALTNVVIETGDAEYGAGIFTFGHLWMTHSTIANNTAFPSGTRSNTGDGAAALGMGELSTATFTDVTVETNTATGTPTTPYAIGAVQSTYYSSLTIKGGSFKNNKTSTTFASALGGAIYAAPTGTFTVTGTSFATNEAIVPSQTTQTYLALGGAIFCIASCTSITNSSFANNLTDATFGAGGAIFEDESTARIAHDTFTTNSAIGIQSGGGAILATKIGVTVTDSTFTNNNATNYSEDSFGGAIADGCIYMTTWVATQTCSESPNIIRTSVFSDNYVKSLTFTTQGDAGGALFLTTYKGNSQITNTKFVGNVTIGFLGAGGALYTQGGKNNTEGTLMVDDSFSTNAASQAGGAIAATTAATLIDDTFSTNVVGNTATDPFGSLGGAVAATLGTLTITGSSFSTNQCIGWENTCFGGAVTSAATRTVITNSTFSGNKSSSTKPTAHSGQGGAIQVSTITTHPQTLELRYDTIVSNVASYGSGIFMGLYVHGSTLGTVISDNTASTTPTTTVNGVATQCNEDNFLASLGSNYIGADPFFTVKGYTCSIPVGSDQIGTTARLAPMAENGGSTLTRVPTNSSPLLAAGSLCPSVDQLGRPRPVINCTIGAFQETIATAYDEVASDGGVFALPQGGTGFYGSMGGQPLNKPIVGIATTPDHLGYWLVASDGGVFAFGDAHFYGSMGGKALNKPIVGIAATSNGGGYWLVASDGGVFAFGNAFFAGSTGNITLNKPIVGIAGDGLNGYWLVASDGGVFNFGSAPFNGSLGSEHLTSPIVGIATNRIDGGYWLAAANGAVYGFGSATDLGTMKDTHLNKPIVGITPTNDGHGYYLVASDGGIFNYGDAAFHGSLGGLTLNKPVVGIG
jgi:hypothetical protein